MPPWIIPELAPEAPDATSFFSNIRVLRPRIAASRAIPVPFTPPPMMITSNSAGLVIFCCSLQEGVEKLLRAHVLPRTLRAPGPTAPRIWACSRRFSVPYWEGRCRRPRLLMRQALLTVLLLFSTGAFAGELQISFQPSSVLLGSGASVSVAVRLPRAD